MLILLYCEFTYEDISISDKSKYDLISKRTFYVVAYYDISTAIDTIANDILLNKLNHHYCVDILRWLTSYL